MTTCLATFLSQLLTTPEMFSTPGVNNIYVVSIIIFVQQYICIHSQTHSTNAFKYTIISCISATLPLTRHERNSQCISIQCTFAFIIQNYLYLSHVSHHPLIGNLANVLTHSPYTSHCLLNYLDAFLFDLNTTPRT